MRWFQERLSRKTVFLLMLSVISVFILFAFVSYNLIRNHYTNLIEDELIKDAKLVSSEIDQKLTVYMTIVDKMQTNEDFQQIIREVDQREFKRDHPLYSRVTDQLAAINELDEKIALSFIALTANDLITNMPDYDSDEDFILREREWYIETINAGETIVTAPYIDLVTGEVVVSVAAPVYDEGEAIGSFAIDVMIEDLRNLITDYGIRETGFSFLIHQKGDVLFHPYEDVFFGSELDDEYGYLTNDARVLLEDGAMEGIYVNEDRMYAYVPIDSAEWVVGTAVPKDEVFSPLNQLLLIYLVMVILAMVLIIFVTHRQLVQIANPVSRLAKHISDFAETGEVIKLCKQDSNRRDELGKLGRGIESMSESIQAAFQENQRQKENLRVEIEEKSRMQNKLQIILTMVANTEEAIIIVDEAFDLFYMNDSFERMFKISPDASNALIAFIQGELLTVGRLSVLQDQGNWNGELELRDANNKIHKTIIKQSRMIVGDKPFYLTNILDVTGQKEREDQLDYLKNFDPITDLHNKTWFERRVIETLTRDKSYQRSALIVLNIKDFRLVNEAKGYAFGNDLLYELAGRLRNVLHENHAVARFDADEYAVFMRNISSYNELYERLMVLDEELNQAFVIRDEKLYVQIVAGVSVYPDDAQDFGFLYSRAATALGVAKRNTDKNYHFYSEAMNTEAYEKFTIRNQLQEAINQKQFSLFYQPQVNIESGETTGFEALIRWEQDGKMISPAVFIPIVESANLIVPVGEWVMEEACRFGRRLYDQGLPSRISVNVSKAQFKWPYILIFVRSVLEKTGLPPHLLELEITEGLLMDHEEECVRILKKLDDIGVRVAIDDFGTGYSSLAYLKKFIVDKIKIDMTFIKDIPESDDGIIAKVIIELAENLGMDVIAEGVEEQAQLDFLLKNRCYEVQGFYYAKPMPEEEVMEYIKKNKDQ